jgi:integrase
MADIIYFPGRTIPSNRTNAIPSPDKYTDKLEGAVDYFSPSGKNFTTEAEALALVGPRLGDTAPYKQATSFVHPFFGLRVMRERQDGRVTKRWTVRYQDAGGADKTDVIPVNVEYGSMNAALEYALAKVREVEARRRLRVGSVPMLGDAISEYIKLKAQKGTDESARPDTIKTYERAAIRLAPWIHLRCDRITTEDCEYMWTAICAAVVAHEKNRNAPGRNGVQAAAQTLRLMHAVMEKLHRAGRIPINPLTPMKKRIYGVRPQRKALAIKRALLPTLWSWLKQQDSSTRWYVTVGIFLGFRRGVLEQLQWGWFDMTTRTIVIPGDVAGNKSGEAFALPVADWLWEHVIMAAYNATDKHPVWVIPSPRLENRPRTDIRGALRGLKRDSKGAIDAHPHVLRATAATVFNSTIKDPLLAARLLGHTNRARADDVPAVTGGYIDNPEQDMREAVNKVAERLLEICDPAALAAWRLFQATGIPPVTRAPDPAEVNLEFDPEAELPDWGLVD